MKKLALFSVFLLIMFHLGAQERELIIRKGHNGVINMVRYGIDPNFVFTAGDDGFIKMWNVNNGFDIITLRGHESSVQCIAQTVDGKFLISGDIKGEIKIWDITKGTELYSVAAHDGAVNVISLMPDGKGFLTGGDDKLIKHWALPDVENIKVISGMTGAIKSLGISPDGSRVIMGAQRSNDVELLLVDLESGDILDDALKKLKGVGAAKAWTAAVLAPMALATSIAKKNVDKEALTFYKFKYSNIEFRKDGKSALISQNLLLPMMAAKEDEDKTGGTAVSILELTDDMNQFKEVRKLQSWNIDYATSRAIFNEDQSKILVNIKNNIRIYDMANADFPEDRKESAAYEPPLVQEFGGDIDWLTSLDISSDFRTVISSDERSNLDLWDIKSGRHIRRLKGFIQPALSVEMMPDGKHILVGSDGKNITMWDITTGQLVRAFNNSYDVNHIDVNKSGTYMITTSPNTKFFKLWNLRSGNMVGSFEEKSENITWVNFAEDDNFIIAETESGNLKQWDRQSKKSKGFKGDKSDYLNKYQKDGIAVSYEGEHLKVTSGGGGLINTSQKDEITDAVIGEDIMVTTNYSGEIIIYDLKTGEIRASMLLVNDFDYVTYSPEYYYTSSKGAAQALAFKQGDSLLPFDQMELVYNRPDKVAESLGFATEKLIRGFKAAYDRRLKRLGLDQDIEKGRIHLPEISIDITTIPLASKTSDFNFELSASDSSYPLSTLNVYVNEVPVFGRSGMSVSGNEINKSIQLKLSKGLNIITSTVTNSAGFTSPDKSFTVNFEGKDILPELFVVTLGVSEYEKLEGLNYAAKDAQDVLNIFSRSGNFGKIHTKILTDSEVTRGSFEEVATFLQSAKVDDVVIIFLAGHGLLNNNFTQYYFAVSSLDPENPEQTGISYESIESLLESIPSRNKLLMMDTCYSGELDSDDVLDVKKIDVSESSFRSTSEVITLKANPFGLENTYELSKALFGDLRRSTGATVIAAAWGNKRAAEGMGFSNGLFTNCLLEGLRTRRADANRDRQFSVTEIQKYVLQRVSDLSNGTQVPTTREENLLNDFKIF